jgi:hypothetical protein
MPYTIDQNPIRSKEGIRNAHKSTIAATPHTEAKKRAHESKRQSHNSKMPSNLSQPNQMWSRSLGVVVCSCDAWGTAPWRLGVLYSPKGPRSRWGFIWKILAFYVCECTRLSGGAPIVHNTTVGESLIGHFPSQMGNRLSGWGHQTIRRSIRPLKLDDVADSRWLSSHRTIPWVAPDHPVIYNQWDLAELESGYFSRTVNGLSVHTGLSDVA